MIPRLAKSVLATALACFPFFIRLWFPSEDIQKIVFCVFALIVGLANFFLVFQPDDRFLSILKPTLDSLFDQILPEATSVDGQRTRPAYRIHVFRPGGFWPVQWLEMAYTFKSDQQDADLGICWWKVAGWCRQGLVWQVFDSGDMGLFKGPGDADTVKKQFGLTAKQAQKTSRVAGILVFPLRSLDTKKGKAINPRVRAVLCIDSLYADSVPVLEEIYEKIRSGKGRDWVEIVDRVALYF